MSFGKTRLVLPKLLQFFGPGPTKLLFAVVVLSKLQF
jgi:hypothetical protein